MTQHLCAISSYRLAEAPMGRTRRGSATRLLLWVPESSARPGRRTAPGLLLVTQVGRASRTTTRRAPLLDHGRHLISSAPPSRRPRRTTTAGGSNPSGRTTSSRPTGHGRGPGPIRRRSHCSSVSCRRRRTRRDLTWLVGRRPGTRSATFATRRRGRRRLPSATPRRRRPITVGRGHSENLIGDRPGTGRAVPSC